MTTSRIELYEQLRNEWVSTHKNHTELDLMQACKKIAKSTGLTVREQIYAKTINSLMEAQ